jgi:hypothetical protein
MAGATNITNKDKTIGKYIQYAPQIGSVFSTITKVAIITERLQLPKTNDPIMNNVPYEIDEKEIFSKLVN